MNIEILNLYADLNDSEIVSSVEFAVIVEGGASQIHIIQLLPIEKTDPNFVSFQFVTKEKVIEWIVKTVGQDYLNKIEKNILLQQNTISKKLDFPWS